jgi:tetratricopeptide (TPR) repeat protein
MKYQTSGAGSVLDTLLVEAFHAYRQGLLRQSQICTPMPPRDFDALKFLGTLGWMPLEARLQLRNLHLACGKGLVAARQDRLVDALGHYERAKELLDLLENDTKLAWLLGVSTYQAGVAYLDFRRDRVEPARERLERAMDADLELEQVGLPVMQMHRIQQGHNLARMYVRLRQREPAIRLAGLLLAYMERRIDELPYHHNWRSKSLQALPRSLLQAMIHQIIGETAGFIVTDHTPEEEWRSLIEASLLCREPETAVFPQVQYALRAEHGRIVNDLESYLHNLERFFRFGIRHCHLLWYAVMVGLVGFCRELGTHRALQVRDVILRDSEKWKGIPSFLRDRLDGSAAQHTAA